MRLLDLLSNTLNSKSELTGKKKKRLVLVMGTGCISMQGRKRTKYTSNEKNESNEKKNV
jgi:hypothetical protein